MGTGTLTLSSLMVDAFFGNACLENLVSQKWRVIIHYFPEYHQGHEMPCYLFKSVLQNLRNPWVWSGGVIS